MQITTRLRLNTIVIGRKKLVCMHSGQFFLIHTKAGVCLLKQKLQAEVIP